MIGELIQGMFNEVVGDDPATRRSAALPYLFTAVAAGGQNALGKNDIRQEVSGPLGP